MKVLLVHNRYRTSAPSGEDKAVLNERRMLERHGVEVAVFDRCNDDIDMSTLPARAKAAVETVWSQKSRRELGDTLRDFRPDIVHVHNTFSVVSPSVYGACRRAGVPVVQTLHNFRFFCPGALFLRDGKPCELCLEKTLFESVRYRCYRDSTVATATLASMLALHRALGTYQKDIDRYIVLTEFARTKAMQGGIPDRKIVIKPNFTPDPPPPGEGGGGYAVFVGRLSEGKGAETLIDAWRQLPSMKLKIVGDGERRAKLEMVARQEGLNVDFLGMQGRAAVLSAIGAADFLVLPSECYEGFPMVIAESFACGTPVLASRLGSMIELVVDGVTGLKFSPGDAKDLAARAQVLAADKSALRRMRRDARAYFDTYLTEAENFRQLMRIYGDTIAEVGQRLPSAAAE